MSLFVFIILYIYFFTLDISFFNNHYYFIILLCILLLGIKANKQFSIDRILFRFSDNHIPSWNYNIIKFQIFCLYFYAGITKLNPDWLQLNTMKASLLYDNEYIDNPLLKSDLAIYIFSYGGLIFDIFIGFLLLYKPTRVFAIIIALIFHLVNYATIEIGIFPILMMFSCLIFIEPSAFESWVFKLFKQKLNNTVKSKVQSDYNNVIKYALTIYITIQLLLPLRHFLIKGNVDWTGEGIMYSWRMKSVARYRGDLKIILLDKNSKKELKVDLYLPKHQQKILFYKPVLFLQLRDYLLQKTNRKKENTIMNVIATASINGSKLSYLIYPNIDLCKVEFNKWSHNKFITSTPKR
ncbi:MAG: HTTM domain-containing protein [Bacteroidetes bacterium]|nr:HTTM domain-containing protein [Bacteroidota bacterium]